jgi:hypothetical protein
LGRSLDDRAPFNRVISGFADEAKGFLVTGLLEMSRFSIPKTNSIHIGHLVWDYLSFTTPTTFFLLHLLCHPTFSFSSTLSILTLVVLREIFIVWGYPLVGLIPKLLWRKLGIGTLEYPRSRHPTKSKTIRLWRKGETTLILLIIWEGLLLLLRILLKLVVVVLPIPDISPPLSRSSPPVSSPTATIRHDHLFRL